MRGLGNEFDHVTQAQACPWCHGPIIRHDLDDRIMWTCPNPVCTWEALILSRRTYDHARVKP